MLIDNASTKYIRDIWLLSIIYRYTCTYKIKYMLSFICVCLKTMSSGTKRILCNHIVYTMNITKTI